MRLTAHWSTILTRSSRSVKEECLRSAPWKVLSTFRNRCLVVICASRLDIFLWPHIISVSLPPFPFSRPYIKKFSPPPRLLFLLPSLPNILHHSHPSSLSSSLPSSPHLISSSDAVSDRCSHYRAQGASPLHLRVMDFQCFDHLTCHVVVSPPWSTSLSWLFRNAWTLLSVIVVLIPSLLTPQTEQRCATPTRLPCCTESNGWRLPLLCNGSSSRDGVDPRDVWNRVIIWGL